MEEYSSVSIIIPNLNGRPFIDRCLRSVLETDYPAFEVIVVDDGSTDGSIEFIKRTLKLNSNLRIICNEKRMGLAASRNLGAKGSNGKYVAFVEVDMEVEPDWLDETVKILEDRQDVGAAECMVLDINNRMIIQSAGYYMVPYFGYVIAKGFGRPYNLVSGAYEVNEHFGDILGLVVRRDLLKEIGGLDELLVHNVDHIDLLWRIWLSGYKVVVVPRGKVYHVTSKSSKAREKYISQLSWNFHFSKIPYIFIKNYELRNLIKYLPWVLMVLLLRGIMNLAKKDPHPMIGAIKALTWNLRVLRINVRERSFVQLNVRKVTDNYILKHAMVPNLLSYIQYFRETRTLKQSLFDIEGS